MRQEVEKRLLAMQGAFERHGGNIELVDVEEESGRVRVRLKGSCRGCPFSALTLKMGVEETLRQEVPGVREVVAEESPHERS